MLRCRTDKYFSWCRLSFTEMNLHWNLTIIFLDSVFNSSRSFLTSSSLAWHLRFESFSIATPTLTPSNHFFASHLLSPTKSQLSLPQTRSCSQLDHVMSDHLRSVYQAQIWSSNVKWWLESMWSQGAKDICTIPHRQIPSCSIDKDDWNKIGVYLSFRPDLSFRNAIVSSSKLWTCQMRAVSDSPHRKIITHTTSEDANQACYQHTPSFDMKTTMMASTIGMRVRSCFQHGSNHARIWSTDL